jgi:hypothetical protein
MSWGNMSVLQMPGSMTETLTPVPTSSIANASAKPSSANLDAQ